jgi:predicted aldo/keto reductase-like oxidoreductase
MEKRELGATGLETSILGFGGFHLVEITAAESARLLGTYLDKGGNYIETAASYGDGISEAKIGGAVAGRRGDYILATKTTQRSREGCEAELSRSLKNLQTDHVDILFMHCVLTREEADRMLDEGGAVGAAEEAQKAGKVGFIGVTGHGRPDGLLHSVSRRAFDVVMTQFNYYDRFSYPTVEEKLLPLCLKKGIGVLAMKALADGYLFKSPGPALRYTLGLPVSSVVMGINSMDLLNSDLKAVGSFKPMSEKEKERLYASAPELGDYVCRLCGKCAEPGFDPQSVFLLEGLFDRQMDDMRVTADSAGYALRERLRFWFGQRDLAVKEYADLPFKVDPEKDYTSLNARCPFGIDIDRKLKIAHAKLSRSRYIA